MKKILLALFALLTGTFCAWNNAVKTKAMTHPVLIELYTSQGCSSCPPADKLLSEIKKEYQDKEVYALSFHVDYWNRLGWTDKFSDAKYAARQRKYAQNMQLESVYTPQVVVNGKAEFVGSSKKEMIASISKIGAQNNSVKITGDLNWELNEVKANCTVSGAKDSDMLYFTLVQKQATTQVLNGENNGRQLNHINVVRAFSSKTIEQGKNNSMQFELPAKLSKDEVELIVFVQEKNQGGIKGVAKLN